MSPSRPAGAADLRLALPAVATWVGAAAGLADRRTAAGLVLLAGVLAAAVRCRPLPAPASRWTALAACACLAAGATAAGLRVAALSAGPVPALAEAGATVSVQAVVTSDPQPRTSTSGPGPPRPYVVLDARISLLTARGETSRVRTPVVVVADRSWLGLLPGQRVAATGRLVEAERGGPAAALLRVRGEPRVLGPPSLASRATEPLRAGLRAAVDGIDPRPAGLVPALVVGDETGMVEEVRQDFRDTGLTHLTAVSGANVAIVLAFVLGAGRWAGVRAAGLPLLGAGAVLGFVLLARPEPSVLRAAAMGLVAVAGLSAGSRRRGLPALGAAVVVLLLVDPWLSRSYGFALSVLATGGILLLGPRWRDALRAWLPRPLAEAVAVPLAAQAACTPVVAALSEAVSMAALPANLLAAPAVAPATVLGLLAALLAPLSPAAAAVAGWLAGWPALAIVAVADHGARLPGAAVPWPATPVGLATLTGLTVLVTAAMPVLLRRRLASLVVALVLVVALLRPLPRPGWPPAGWLLVACDVGQGDALVVAAGEGAAVVVDVGPDPAAIDRCLRDLGIRQVPVAVLSHFHADHVDGLPGLLRDRVVGELVVSPLDEPAEQAGSVRRQAAAAGVPVTPAAAGEWRRAGAVTWQVLWPRRLVRGTGSAPNDSSVVLRVEIGGVSMLLTGDIEPAAQRALLAAGAALPADVLKVPHHGSAAQDPAFLAAVGARVELVSVGADNDYGHPAPAVLRALQADGGLLARTDRHGSVAVVARDGALLVVRQRADERR